MVYTMFGHCRFFWMNEADKPSVIYILLKRTARLTHIDLAALAGMLRNHDIWDITLPPNKIFNCLRPVKNRVGVKTPGVYCIPFQCGNRSLITLYTRACHLSLLPEGLIQTMPSHPTFQVHFEYYPPISSWIYQVVSFLQVSQPLPSILFTSPPQKNPE
jgi:hypothetical protein